MNTAEEKRVTARVKNEVREQKSGTSCRGGMTWYRGYLSAGISYLRYWCCLSGSLTVDSAGH